MWFKEYNSIFVRLVHWNAEWVDGQKGKKGWIDLKRITEKAIEKNEKEEYN